MFPTKWNYKKNIDHYHTPLLKKFPDFTDGFWFPIFVQAPRSRVTDRSKSKTVLTVICSIIHKYAYALFMHKRLYGGFPVHWYKYSTYYPINTRCKLWTLVLLVSLNVYIGQNQGNIEIQPNVCNNFLSQMAGVILTCFEVIYFCIFGILQY